MEVDDELIFFPLNPSISTSGRRIKRPPKPLHLEPKNSYEDHSFCFAVAQEEEPNGVGLEIDLALSA